MAGRYSKTYTRKKGASAQITQFDQLLADPGKSTHPTAAKTAGHVGKWGTTSFTSMRSMNGSYGNQENTKRPRSEIESPSSFGSDDPFALDSFDGETSVPKPIIESKKRKFFKSRDQASGSGYKAPSVPSAENHQETVKAKKSTPPINEQDKINKISENKSPSAGIKLKIFKSRNTESSTNEVYSSKVELPSEDSSDSDAISDLSSRSTESPPSFNKEPTASNVTKSVPYKKSNSFKHSTPPSSEDPIDFTQSTLPNLKKSTDVSMSCTLPVMATQMEDVNLSEQSHRTESKVKSVAKESLDLASSDHRSSQKQTNSDSKPSYSGSVDLFGTDFDENEIIDRTNIDYLGNNKQYSEPMETAETAETESIGPFDDPFEPPTVDTDTQDIMKPEPVCDVPVLTKKRSIFKSRAADGDSKKRAMYRHKWHSQEDKEEPMESKLTSSKSLSSEGHKKLPQMEETPCLQRVHTWPSTKVYDNFSDEEQQPRTSVKCSKTSKQYYTVIKNVKRTHQLQESGEFQEFNDDVEYFLDALRSTNSVSTRCLASLNLAQKCMTPAFRMHLRAHGTVIKFFKALTDAHTSHQLGETVALVMFILSQDHLNMDLDRGSLELMLNLLDTDGLNEIDTSEVLTESRKKVKQLCKELQQKGHAKHLGLHNINAATLAMETLLSLTSKRAGEWFKEELRTLGGVDHLVRTVHQCSSRFSPDITHWNPVLLEKLSKAERCLKVLENVTLQNVANQEYLLTKMDNTFPCMLLKIFHMCNIEVPLYSTNSNCVDKNATTSKALIATHITTMKVLINLTHGSGGKEALGSKILGADYQVYDLTLNCLLVLPTYLDHDNKFEIQVLACCLLLNLIENSPQNRDTLMKSNGPSSLNMDIFEAHTPKKTAMETLVQLFYSSNTSAQEQEAHTDQIIDEDLVPDPNDDDKKDEDIADTVARLFEKAGRHMEDTLIAAYTALLAGYCIMDNDEYSEQIRAMQPDKNFKTMVTVLKKFLHFMKLTATTSLLRSLKPTEKVVEFMEKLDRNSSK